MTHKKGKTKQRSCLVGATRWFLSHLLLIFFWSVSLLLSTAELHVAANVQFVKEVASLFDRYQESFSYLTPNLYLPHYAIVRPAENILVFIADKGSGCEDSWEDIGFVFLWVPLHVSLRWIVNL